MDGLAPIGRLLIVAGAVLAGVGLLMSVVGGIELWPGHVLGIGVPSPVPSWGNMIADGKDQLATAPWTSLFPGLAIAVVVMALTAVGDALRDALDPGQETA